jgi:outer membrane protein TolC
MKLKNIFLLVLLLSLISNANAQTRTIGLKECIRLALANKAIILALKTDAVRDSLNIQQMRAKNLPQIALAYDYLYNPIIRTNIVPVGQFSAVASNETRAIRFGTTFNQSAGLLLMQPIFDVNIRSKLIESKLQYRLKQDELNSANDELIFEVAQTFVSILTKQELLEISKFDTLRTRKTMILAQDRFEKGSVLKMELNKTIINHNNAVFAYTEMISALVIDKIYLNFLTNLNEESYEIADVDSIFIEQKLNAVNQPIATEKLAKVIEFESRINLLRQQLKSEKFKYLPTLQLKGYLGADQFSNELKPFQSGTWFGNSFVGIGLKMPILLGENKSITKNQFQSQMKSLDFQKQEEQERTEKNRQTALQNISVLQEQAKNYSRNLALLKENISLYNERLQSGQETFTNVNLEEIDYQKELQKLSNVKNSIWQQWLLFIKNAGMIKNLY